MPEFQASKIKKVSTVSISAKQLRVLADSIEEKKKTSGNVDVDLFLVEAEDGKSPNMAFQLDEVEKPKEEEKPEAEVKPVEEKKEAPKPAETPKPVEEVKPVVPAPETPKPVEEVSPVEEVKPAEEVKPTEEAKPVDKELTKEELAEKVRQEELAKKAKEIQDDVEANQQ